MITEDYVSFETAKLLKEKGFDWGCTCINYPPCGTSLIGHMINNTGLQLTREGELCIDKENLLTIPTLQMAMKWLREVHSLWCEISWEGKGLWCMEVFSLMDEEFIPDSIVHEIKSYEEACETAIKYCLENLI